MNKLLVLFLSLGLVLPAAAQVSTSTSRPGKDVPPQRQEIKNIRIEAKQDIREIKQVTRENIQTAREDFKAKVEMQRTELKKTIQTHRDELKEKLKTIKDERKKASVEKIDQRLTDLNSRRTAHYVNVLDQIDRVLVRIVAKTDAAKASGKDVVSVETAITKAHQAIAAARTAIAAQVTKVYTMKVEGDATLKKNVGATRDMLHSDLKKVEGVVKDAREAVHQAAVALGGVPGIKDVKTPPQTPSSTPSSTPTSTPTSTNQ